MIAGAVARRYAKAILELGNETGALEKLVEEMTDAARAYEQSAELRAALENPLFPLHVKRGILDELVAQMGLSPLARNTLFLLNDRRRLAALPGIAKLLREMSDARKGVVRAEVVTAAPLSEAYYQRLQAQLERLTGKKVVVDKREDPSLIAGVITRIGDTLYDGSLRSRLNEIKHTLTPS